MILVDTNVLVAAARTADTNHDAAARLLETLDEPLLVPPTVLAEVCYLLDDEALYFVLRVVEPRPHLRGHLIALLRLVEICIAAVEHPPLGEVLATNGTYVQALSGVLGGHAGSLWCRAQVGAS